MSDSELTTRLAGSVLLLFKRLPREDLHRIGLIADRIRMLMQFERGDVFKRLAQTIEPSVKRR